MSVHLKASLLLLPMDSSTLPLHMCTGFFCQDVWVSLLPLVSVVQGAVGELEISIQIHLKFVDFI